MTKVIKYFGNNNPITVTHDSEFNARDFRPLYKCDSDKCNINNSPVPSGKVVSFGGDLHACKLYKECRDNVAELWEHKRKTFDPKIFLSERVQFFIEKFAIDNKTAYDYAKIDLQNKMRELKINKVKQKKKYKMTDDNKQKYSLRIKKMWEYVRQGYSKKEAMTKATKDVFSKQI